MTPQDKLLSAIFGKKVTYSATPELVAEANLLTDEANHYEWMPHMLAEFSAGNFVPVLVDGEPRGASPCADASRSVSGEIYTVFRSETSGKLVPSVVNTRHSDLKFL
jgi:hypothetical protein